MEWIELWGLALVVMDPMMGLGCTSRHVRGPSKDFHVVWPPPRVVSVWRMEMAPGRMQVPRILTSFPVLLLPFLADGLSEIL